ncbi:PPR domain-containing protein [Cephalotus follicularis]|uniref:PPR domain-containing protein n=1 Tax=Cephalotus follicularis TaxID=3775 RepID=A0A1Q3BT62_CEPFO|nr:PPR domain-containing protein [Cephalotus follicularis]
MISGYIKAGEPRSSLNMFLEMLGFGVEPTAFDLSAVIKACLEIGDLKLGRYFHGFVMRGGFDSDQSISSALITMYGKNFESNDARRLFDEMPEPNAINLGRLKQGKEVHANVVTSDLCGDVVIENNLVDMFEKRGSVAASRRVFYKKLVNDSVSWSALLAAYCQNRDLGSVIKLFRETQKPNLHCYAIVLRACSGLAVVRQGKEVHCQYVRRGVRDVIVESVFDYK